MRNEYYFYSNPSTPRKEKSTSFVTVMKIVGQEKVFLERVLKQADYFVSKYLNSDKNGLVFTADNDPIISRSRLATF